MYSVWQYTLHCYLWYTHQAEIPHCSLNLEFAESSRTLVRFFTALAMSQEVLNLCCNGFLLIALMTLILKILNCWWRDFSKNVYFYPIKHGCGVIAESSKKHVVAQQSWPTPLTLAMVNISTPFNSMLLGGGEGLLASTVVLISGYKEKLAQGSLLSHCCYRTIWNSIFESPG